jgi:hypothetical protein
LQCETYYTLYPNGDIAYEQRNDGLVSSALGTYEVAPSTSGEALKGEER